MSVHIQFITLEGSFLGIYSRAFQNQWQTILTSRITVPLESFQEFGKTVYYRQGERIESLLQDLCVSLLGTEAQGLDLLSLSSLPGWAKQGGQAPRSSKNPHPRNRDHAELPGGFISCERYDLGDVLRSLLKPGLMRNISSGFQFQLHTKKVFLITNHDIRESQATPKVVQATLSPNSPKSVR